MLDKFKDLKSKHGPKLKAWWEGTNAPGSVRVGIMGDDAHSGGDEYTKGMSVRTGALDSASGGEAVEYMAGGSVRGGGPRVANLPYWEGTRNDLLKKIWGEGNAAPTEPEFFGQMYSQLALNSSMTVLDIGDGLAGAAVHMAKEYKTYVDCYLSNPNYMMDANKFAQEKGVQAHVRIKTYDIKTFQPEKKYDVVSIRRILWRVPDLPKFFNMVSASLKPNGRLVMADYAAEPLALSKPLMNGWFLQEQFANSPSLSDLREVLPRAGFDVRVSTEITKQHLEEIKRGLQHLQEFLKKVRVSDANKQMVLAEAERWAIRSKLMGEGLQLYRFFAQKK